MAQKRKFYAKTSTGVEEQLIASAADIVEIDPIDGLDADTVQDALEQLVGIASEGGVTGVKGDDETTYRQGQVNITKANIGLGNVTNDAQVKRSEMGAAGGVATLDTTGKVPSSQLPSYVDDVLVGILKEDGKFYSSGGSVEITAETGKIYVDYETNKQYRWGGESVGYVEISASLALGETSSTAFPGNRGVQAEQRIGDLETDVTELLKTKTDNLHNVSVSPDANAGNASANGRGVSFGGTIELAFEDNGTEVIRDNISANVEIPIVAGENITLTPDTTTNTVKINSTLPDTGVVAGTYSAVAVDAKGRVTAGSQIIEWGTSGQTTPTSNLAVGGLFFALIE